MYVYINRLLVLGLQPQSPLPCAAYGSSSAESAMDQAASCLSCSIRKLHAQHQTTIQQRHGTSAEQFLHACVCV